jgi:S-(hydroxymethyl)glutathione dehydrogenase / alcohol dehydrogenase
MKTRAALWTSVNEPLTIAQVDLMPPNDDEVLVAIKASGVCHSDLNGTRDHTMASPTILGHEGAGIVVETGKNVAHVAPGDHVVLSWLPYCDHCFYCGVGQKQLCETVIKPLFEGTLMDGTTRFRYADQAVHHYSLLSTFAEHTVVPARSCVKIPRAMPFAQASLIGCGVATGYGAAVNAARITPGSTVGVFGFGGVGAAAVQGAVASGAERVVAIDRKEINLKAAKEFGATHTSSAEPEELRSLTYELTGGRGFDFTIDTTGSTAATRQAFELTRKGGTVVVVGAFQGGDVAVTAPGFHRIGKTLKGSFYGDVNPIEGLADLVDLYLAGKLVLDNLVRERIPLTQINEALKSFDDPAVSNVGRAVIVF